MTDTRVDLSHYDLQNHFTAREAACLIVGIDPNALASKQLSAAATTIQLAITGAYQAALARMQLMLPNHPHVTAYRMTCLEICWFGGEDKSTTALPSHELWRAAYVDDSDTFLKQHAMYEDVGLATFKREDITRWLTLKGYKKQPCYFLPHDVTVATINDVNNQENATHENSTAWQITAHQRYDDLGDAITRVLDAAFKTGKAVPPKAKEVAEKLQQNKWPSFIEMASNGIVHYNSKGEQTKTTYESLQKRINRLVQLPLR